MPSSRLNPGTYYDADAAPKPAEWLSMSDQERLRLVVNYLVASGVRAGANRKALSLLGAENYLAQGFGPATKGLKRLVDAGSSRSEAIGMLATCLERSYSLSAETPSSLQAHFAAELALVQPGGSTS